MGLRKIRAEAGTVGWADPDGARRILIISEQKEADFKAKGIKYILFEAGEVVGYEHFDGHISNN